MPKLIINVSAEVISSLERVVKDIEWDEAASTHGKLTTERLAEMLLEDASCVIREPDRWEASKMRDLLSAHGYGVRG